MHTKYFNKENKEVPSVTTILKVINKPSLLGWTNYLGFRGIQYQPFLEHRANIGTLVHERIECDILGKVYIAGYDYETLEVLDRFRSYLNWKDSIDFDPIFSEQSLTCDTYGGTVDCLCNLNGEKTILDWKTSKSFHTTMFIQLAAYRKLLKVNGYGDIHQVGIVLVKQNKCEMKLINGEEIDGYYNIFTSALKLYKELIEIGYEL